MSRVWLVLLVFLLPAAAQEPRFAADRPLDLRHVKLVAGVDLKKKTLRGRVTLQMVALRDTSVIRLDAVRLEISKVEVYRGEPAQPQPAEHASDGETLEIQLPQPVRRGEPVTVHVTYVCAEPQAGWAQQYTHDMKPAPARWFEPASINGATTSRNIRTLIDLYTKTGAEKFLAPIPAAIEWLDAFYRRVGKTPITLKKEIEGYVANRLQRVLLAEASRLVAQGVCEWIDVETAVTKGPGFRWPVQGPVLHRHLGGGPGGVRHMIAHLGWRGDPQTKRSFIDTVDRRWGHIPMQELEDWRDDNMLVLLQQLREAP